MSEEKYNTHKIHYDYIVRCWYYDKDKRDNLYLRINPFTEIEETCSKEDVANFLVSTIVLSKNYKEFEKKLKEKNLLGLILKNNLKGTINFLNDPFEVEKILLEEVMIYLENKKENK